MSSLEQQADFKITATWEDNTTQPMIASTEKINLAWKRVRDEQRSVRREFEINNRTLLSTSRVISTVSSVVRRGITIFQTWTLMQIRAQDSARNLRDAQKDLNDILVEFGPNSKEYLDALQDVKDAEEELARTNRDNLVGSLLLVVDTIATVANTAIRAIPRIKEFISVSKGAGSFGKIGGAAKVIGGVGGAALLGAGVIGSGALNPDATFEDKLLSTGESALGGALLGATIGSVVPGIGTAIGGGVGAAAGTGLGIATNFGPEIMDFFSKLGSGGITINNIINSPTANQMSMDMTNSTKRAIAFRAT